MCYTQFRMSQVLDSDNSNLFSKQNNDECKECGDTNVGECGSCDEHCICEDE